MNKSESYSLKETPGESGPLNLPDWSGQLPHRSRVPNDQWLSYCRSNLPKLRVHPGYRSRRLQHGVEAEFTL